MTAADQRVFAEYLAAKFGRTIFPEGEEQAKREALRKSLSEDLTAPGVYCRWLKEACVHQNGDELDEIMLLGWTLELFDEDSVAVLEGISLENWVKANNLEDLVGLIECYGSDNKLNALAAMALQKYPGQYLGEEDEAIARKAMWALHRLYKQERNETALTKIIELSKCGDSMVEGFAKHHLEKLGMG